MRSETPLDHVDNKLCWINIAHWSSTILGKVPEHGRRVFACGTKIGSSATFGKKKKDIKGFEESGGRLMDGTNDRLTSHGELAHETADLES
ncbi:hypothetical protein HG531_005910 [Fusarium graminearum]|nr:hypothetical protein HG531_005910 [Fusarium graminearum]